MKIRSTPTKLHIQYSDFNKRCHISNIAFQWIERDILDMRWQKQNRDIILYHGNTYTFHLPLSLLYRMRDEVKKTTNEEDGEEDKILSEIEEEQVRFYENQM